MLGKRNKDDASKYGHKGTWLLSGGKNDHDWHL